MHLPRFLAPIGVYLDRRVLVVLFLGFSSGLPLALTFATLTARLAEAGIDKTSIGLFLLVGLPYSFKFFWAPLIDRLPLGPLTRILGRRRGWALLTQAALAGSLIGMAHADPMTQTGLLAVFALLTAFCSASQDVVIDAYRVEILDERQQGAGAATVVLGYRFGMLASGAGALYLASFFDWRTTYLVMAALVGIGMATVLLCREPAVPLARAWEGEARVAAALARRPGLRRWQAGLIGWFFGAVVAPFAQFMSRPGWLLILAFVALYKLGDVMAGALATPFYLELGFSKIEIANVTKVMGLGAVIVGGLAGGLIVSRLGIMKSLFVCGVLQLASNLCFAWLAQVGYDLPALTLVITLENLSGGMGTAAFVAYLSSLCNIGYTATQYALLTSFAALARDSLAASSGWFVETLGWPSYFVFTAGTALPGLLLLSVLALRAGEPVADPGKA
ncbi:MAG TPA: AmpG family muropeptide MFS transporter [Arenibaculum sp.]|nr:AmpG family muropeptide MFS transporter [Arenibaculum sp.]